MINWLIMQLVYIAMVVVNILSNMLPINGQTASEISSRINVLITPAGYVFSIWGVIYGLLAIWLYLLWKKIKTIDTKTYSKLTYLFVLSCLLNISWLFSFHYEKFILSTFVIIALLIVLIAIYLLYPVGDSRFSGRLPFSIYLGWVSVATIVNISYTLKYYNISLGIDEVTGTIILLIIAGLLALIGLFRANDPYFALVFVWAIIGVARSNDAPLLVNAAYIIAIVIFIVTIAAWFRKKKSANR